jgi:hypothetical protein
VGARDTGEARSNNMQLGFTPVAAHVYDIIESVDSDPTGS